MVLNVDIAPTLLDAAGVAVPKEMQGRSMVPLLKDPKAEWRKDWLYEYYEYPGPHSVRKNRGVRSERYKYIHYYEEPQEFELYDLQKDPEERDNLYGKSGYEEVTASLRKRLQELRKETGDTEK
jgi:arylsulfatase A-like enzyme